MNGPEHQEVEDVLALIRVGHRLEGQDPDDPATDRAQRVLTGETSLEDARDELRKKWGSREGS